MSNLLAAVHSTPRRQRGPAFLMARQSSCMAASLLGKVRTLFGSVFFLAISLYSNAHLTSAAGRR